MTALWGRKRRRDVRPKLSRREAWREVGRRLGGTFEEGRRPGKDQLAVEHGPWSLRLDTYTESAGTASVTYTRVNAFFVGRADMRLSVRRRNVLDRLVEGLGFGGFTTGDRRLAERFVIRGKPETRLRPAITAGLAEAIMAHPFLRLEVKPAPRKHRKAYGHDTRRATVRASGVVTDPPHLEGLFAVVREALDALERIGVAARQPVAPIAERARP